MRESKAAGDIQICGSLDCCKDPKCPLCHGKGYIIPLKKKVKP